MNVTPIEIVFQQLTNKLERSKTHQETIARLDYVRRRAEICEEVLDMNLENIDPTIAQLMDQAADCAQTVRIEFEGIIDCLMSGKGKITETLINEAIERERNLMSRVDNISRLIAENFKEDRR